MTTERNDHDRGKHSDHGDHGARNQPGQHPVDLGLTHVALPVSNMDASLAFYAEYADMHPVHQRGEAGERVAWITDSSRPFVVVLLERSVDHRLGGWSHLGVGVASREDVDRTLARAAEAGFEALGPFDAGPPVGYWGIIQDPDGHNLELAHGQEVGFTVTGV